MADENSSRWRLAHERVLRGWGQSELSRRSGLPRSSVQAIESGRLTPSVDTAIRLAKILECSVEELFWVSFRFATKFV